MELKELVSSGSMLFFPQHSLGLIYQTGATLMILKGKGWNPKLTHDDDRDACTLFAFAGQIEKRMRRVDS